ncbi:lipase family protein [Campylobacter rectus]|uniref:Putative lipase n=3 Tax=Campylobacter rectus TaxID=203 RepID=A0A6G5QM68_CAMRE|nr:hypothetical protein [Campylobacter rectus]QCD46805.1 putative lipase [Campylobacter rectus]UEB47510.1 hypothetical protein LK437_11015 [Campylobacter rectus]
MSKYGELKIYSELAWAGYADFLSADDSGDISTTGMQRYNFRKQFKVIDSYEQREGGSGFQATLFQNRDTEEYILSIRGTEIGIHPIKWYETIKDTIIADGNLAISSMPGSQTLDMINFINKLNNESKIPEKQKITIVGHSLGGALAQIASKMFPDLFSKVYTFNAPSGKSLVYKKIYKDGEKYFWIGNEQINSKHYVDKNTGEAFYNYQNSPMTTSVTDVRAKDAFSLIANLWWKERFGELVEVSGESHSMAALSKILYFYDEMIKNGIREEEITDYLSGFHKGSALFGHNGNGVERVANKTLNVINKIVNGNNAEQKDIIDIAIDFEKNDTKFSINLLHRDSSVSSFFTNSSIPISALYALVHLNPFIVSGVDSPAYKEFEKYKDEYSDDYIKDKAKMFEAALKYPDKKPVNFNYFDIETKKELYSNPAGNSDKETDVVFGVNLDETIQARPNFNNRIYALAGNDSIKGGKHDNYIEAGSGNDTIDLRGSKGENTVYGGVNNGKDNDDDGDDTIYAGQGKDTIYGGNGKDTIYTDNDDKEDLLYGGDGFDTYYVGDKDIIFDSDGKGKVVFDGVELTGGTYDKDKEAYVSKDGLIEYRLNESGGKSTLIVQKGDKSITINEFSKEDKSLGIKLANSKIEVSVTNKEGSANWLKESLGDRGLPFTLSLNRKLDKGEYLKVEVVTSMKGDKSIIEFKERDISKDFNFTWEDDNYPQGNRSFVVNACVVDESSDLTAEVISSARGTIKDDDRDPDPDPDSPNDTFPDTTPASTKTSPIVIDLNGDGVKTISRKNGKTYFDLDNNKFAENTSWIDKNDGILINKTLIANSVTNGSELFGNHTLLRDGSLANNGFEALKEFVNLNLLVA